MSNTKTPWMATQSSIPGSRDWIVMGGGHFRDLAAVCMVGIDGDYPAQKNAERIVACVNALDGIQKPEEFMHNLQKTLQEALSALEDATQYVDASGGERTAYEYEAKAIRATLREMEGIDEKR